MWLDNNYSEHWPSQEEQQASDTEERFISHRQGGSKVEKGATSSQIKLQNIEQLLRRTLTVAMLITLVMRTPTMTQMFWSGGAWYCSDASTEARRDRQRRRDGGERHGRNLGLHRMIGLPWPPPQPSCVLAVN